ncbi:hypothetical protein BZG02_10405 [Labilibaculum filiforme]|uniref:Uncharacterized protein n=1 Tax=Labilibaculum filiforme TaxID=1940526 RepID=A0A2N3HYT6_9BACT|nr:hypothetical protein BZG02_10405 [Labilibaculum filiforme]
MVLYSTFYFNPLTLGPEFWDKRSKVLHLLKSLVLGTRFIVPGIFYLNFVQPKAFQLIEEQVLHWRELQKH